MTVSLQRLQTQNWVPVPWKWPSTGWTRKSLSLQMLSLPSYSQTWSFKWATSKRICAIPSWRPNTSKQIKHIAMHDAAIKEKRFLIAIRCLSVFYNKSKRFRLCSWLISPDSSLQWLQINHEDHGNTASHDEDLTSRGKCWSQKSWSKVEFPGRWWELPAMLDSTPEKYEALVLLACNSWHKTRSHFTPWWNLPRNPDIPQINSITY